MPSGISMTMPLREPIGRRARVARYLTRALVNHFDSRNEAFDAMNAQVARLNLVLRSGIASARSGVVT
jgi:hypothetical protein